MRPHLCSFVLSAVLVASIASAQEQNKTDVEMDWLNGPVKSVSSAIARSDVKWQQPGGPTLVAPIWCRDCEYDPDGTKTKAGQFVEGKFFGEVIRLIRDADGHVTDRFSYSTSTGELQRHDVMAPFGKTEQKTYIGGKLRYRSTFSYDENGHLSEWLSFDRAGNLEGRTSLATNKEGTVTRRSVYGKNGLLSYEQRYDPETQIDHFTTFDELGNVKLTSTLIHGKLTSFWEAHESASQFGEGFMEPIGDGSFDNYSCHDLGCDVSHVHYEYLNGDKHTPQSSEWRDSEGNLKLAAYFEYEVDAFRNWTYRRVWVWNPDLRGRALYETDFRAISYWK
jgi:hypothetical protein